MCTCLAHAHAYTLYFRSCHRPKNIQYSLFSAVSVDEVAYVPYFFLVVFYYGMILMLIIIVLNLLFEKY